LDSVHFHRMRKEAIQFLHMQEKLGKYSHKLSIISKQSKLMQKELRYQVKTEAISDMPRKEKFPAISPKFFFFKKKMLYGNNIVQHAKHDQTGVGSMLPIHKNSRPVLSSLDST